MLKIPDHLHCHEGRIQNVLLKSIKKIEEYTILPYNYFNEYLVALDKYVGKVFEMIIVGLALELKVDPSSLKKSLKIQIRDLIKISQGDIVHEKYLMYKGFFDSLKDKFSFFSKWMRRFNFNRGKKLEPLKFKHKFVYNPETKKPLTNKEFDDMSNDIIEFLGDKLEDTQEQMFVRAGLMGKLAQKMEQEGIPLSKQKKMTYDQLEKKFGKMPDTLKEAKKKFDLKKKEEYAIQYAMNKGAEYLSIEKGELYNNIVNSVRKQIVQGLQEGIDAKELTSRLYWIDPSDKLGKQFKDDTIEAWNRDFRRIAVTELSYANQAGYLAAHREADPKGKQYFVFSGSIIKNSSKFCRNHIGKIVLLVDESRDSDKIKDKYTDRCIWIGKNNVGRNENEWWVTIPAHPNCIHNWQKIDPETQEWDSEIKKIIFKE